MQTLVVTSLSISELEAIISECLKNELRHATPPRHTGSELPPRILNLNEAAAFVGLAKATVYKLTSAGTIPHAKRGKKLVFEREALEAWLLENRVQPNEAENRAADTLAASIARRRRE